RIGIMPATLGKLVLTRALEAANLAEENVTLVTLDSSQHEAAFQNQEIDALITYDPVLAKLQAKGAKVLFDSTQMPGEIVDLLVGREELVSTHEKQLAVLLKGWFKALKYIETNPDDAIARIAEREAMTPEQVVRGLSQLEYPSLSENLVILNKSDTASIEGMKNLAEFLKKSQILETVVDPIQLLDPRPLESVS
ncbi:MAG: ABC transporter substrate-binding protein, partial [Phormidesmis sp.]